MKNLRHYFVTGIATLLPVSVTVLLFWFIITKLGSIFRPLLAGHVLLSRLPSWGATVMGFVLFLIIVLVIGAVASGFLGKFVLGWVDKLLHQVPIVRDVYGSARQLTDAVFIKRSSLRKTVLAEYPSKGLFALGFVTTDESIGLPDGRNALWVFFPTAPNPTTGWLALVPDTDVTETDMSIEEGLKLVVSGGLLRPAGGHYSIKPAELHDA